MNETLAVSQFYVDHRIVTSSAGREFDPAADRWVLSKDRTLNLQLALCHVAESLRGPYRAVMVHLAQNYSARYCACLHDRLAAFLRQTGTNLFTTTALINYRSGLDRSTEYKLGNVRAFLKHWYELGYPGVPAEVIDLLDSWTLRGNQKGAVVKSMDPLEGPLDDLELQAFNEKASQMFEKGEIKMSTLAFALLLSHTGRRPGQLLLTRIGDLFSGKRRESDPFCVVRIPRVKQKGKPAGSETKAFEIEAKLYRLLEAQADSVVKDVSSRFNYLPKDLIGMMPLFPKWSQLQDISNASTLALRLQDDSLYETTQVMNTRLRKIKIISDRTGKLISIPPRRFRYTQGTRAAREGLGEYVIAELLDHSDTQSARIYVRDHPNFRYKIDDAVGQLLIPLAQAYAGTLVDRESDAINGTDLSKRVRNATTNLGTCGSQGFCGAHPVACYTCANFQAWVDAPHEIVLDGLLAQRKQILKITGDEAVASATNRSIQAVRLVISLCEKQKAELAKENNE